MRIVEMEDGTEFVWWDSVCFEVATAIAAVGVVATLAGAGVSYMAAQQTASSASAQQNYNAQVAKNNQQIADQAAADAQSRGAISQAQKAYATAQLIGKQRAGLAANGEDVNSGSALSLQSDTAANGEFDELTLKNNAQREAVGYQNQGINYQNQAQLDEAASASALAGGALKADASLISGAGQVASQWYNFNYGTKQSGPGSLNS